MNAYKNKGRLEREFHLGETFAGEGDGIDGVEARIAVLMRVRDDALDALKFDIVQGVGCDELPYLVYGMGVCDELAARGRVYPVEARALGGRAADDHVHLAGASALADHLHDLLARGAAHDGVVHHYHALALKQAPDRVELDLHAEVADAGLGLDEGPANVVVADEAEVEGYPGFLCIADGGWHAGVWHGYDDVRVYGGLAVELAAEFLPDLVDVVAAEDMAVRAGEVDVLEHAEALALAVEDPLALKPVLADMHDLPGLDVADVLGLDEVQCARLGGHHVGAVEYAQAERPHPVGVAHCYHLPLAHEQEAVCAAYLREGVYHLVAELSVAGACHEVQYDLGVRGALEYGALVLEFVAEAIGVYERAVVCDGDGALVEVGHDGLDVLDARASGSGVAVVAYGVGAGQAPEAFLAEDVRHEAHALFRVEVLAVAACDARAFLAAVLEGVEAQVHEVGGLGMPVDTEDPALFLELVLLYHVFRISSGHTPLESIDQAASRFNIIISGLAEGAQALDRPDLQRLSANGEEHCAVLFLALVACDPYALPGHKHLHSIAVAVDLHPFGREGQLNGIKALKGPGNAPVCLICAEAGHGAEVSGLKGLAKALHQAQGLHRNDGVFRGLLGIAGAACGKRCKHDCGKGDTEQFSHEGYYNTRGTPGAVAAGGPPGSVQHLCHADLVDEARSDAYLLALEALLRVACLLEQHQRALVGGEYAGRYLLEPVLACPLFSVGEHVRADALAAEGPGDMQPQGQYVLHLLALAVKVLHQAESPHHLALALGHKQEVAVMVHALDIDTAFVRRAAAIFGKDVASLLGG